MEGDEGRNLEVDREAGRLDTKFAEASAGHAGSGEAGSKTVSTESYIHKGHRLELISYLVQSLLLHLPA